MEMSLRHDEEGFLIGRAKAGLIDQKLQTVVDNTEATLKLLKGRVNGNRVIVSGRVRVTGLAANASSFSDKRSVTPVYRMAANQTPLARENLIRGGRRADGKDANKSLVKSIKAAAPAAARMPLAKQGDQHLTKSEARRQRRQQALELRESQKQTKLLKDIKTKSDSTSGLLKMLLPFLLGGGLLKSILQAPAAILGGKAAASGALRGADGKFIKGGAAAGGLAKGKFLKGLGRAGIIGALVSAWNGINVESSDLSREDKNKAHTKNLVVSAGGIGGAMAGAKAGALMGSVVPGWGTAIGGVVGGVLGGFGGAELTSLVVEKIDQVFPEGFGQMLGSWDGFIGGLKTLGAGAMGQMNAGAKYVYYEVLPTDIAIAIGTITGIGRDAWASITGFASDSWAEVTRLATPYYNAATKFASDAWTSFSNTVGPWFETIGGYAQSAFNTFSQLSGQFFTWLGNTWLGQQAGAAWDGVKSAANSVADWAGEKYDAAAGYVDEKRKQASQDYQAGKNGRGQVTGASVAVGGAMVMGNVAAVNAHGAQAKGAKNKGFKGFGSDVDAHIKEASQRYGIDEKVLRGFVKMEGGWTGAMSNTGAIGTGQFTESSGGDPNRRQGTWNTLAKSKEGQSIGMTLVTRGNFRNQDDPRRNKRINTLATALLAKQNAEVLKRAGVPVTGANLYMAHNIGPRAVIDVSKGRTVGKASIKAMNDNGKRPDETAEQFFKRQSGRYQKHYNEANNTSEKPLKSEAAVPLGTVSGKKFVVSSGGNIMSKINLPAISRSSKVAEIKPVSSEVMRQSVSVAAVSKLGSQKPVAHGQTVSGQVVDRVDGPIAHMPQIGRSVSNKHIANIVSGGINMV